MYLINVMAKLNFHSETICWFAAQETFLISINVKNRCGVSYFCGNSDFFRWITWWKEYSKEQHLFDI